MIPLSVLDLSPIVRGQRCRAGVAQHARSGAPRRAVGLPPLLAGRASQHARHRQRGDLGRDRARRAAARRTIRVGAGGIMLPNHSPLAIAEQFGTLESLYPGPDRSRARPRAGIRRPDRARAAAQLAGRRGRRLSAGRARADRLLPRRRRPGARRARRRPAGADLDPRLEHVRRAARRGARPAVRVRLALRAGADDAGDRALPRAVPSRPRSSPGRT